MTEPLTGDRCPGVLAAAASWSGAGRPIQLTGIRRSRFCFTSIVTGSVRAANIKAKAGPGWERP
jgi:hypothetical protein